MSSENEYNWHKKTDLMHTAEDLASDSYDSYKAWMQAREQMKEVIAEWKNTGSVVCRESKRYSDDPAYDLNTRFSQALDDFFSEGNRLKEQRDEEFLSRNAEKESIIEQARTLLEWKNPHEAFKRFRELLDEFKGIGFSGEWSDTLWSSMMEVGDSIKEQMSERKEEARGRESAFDSAAAAKRGIISSLEASLADAKGGQRIQIVRDAQAKWKSVGSAGRVESELWERFSKIVDPVRKAAAEHGKLLAERADKKRQIIEDAEKLKASGGSWSDFRKLLEHWKSIGPSGREESDLWQRFNKIGDAIKGARG